MKFLAHVKYLKIVKQINNFFISLKRKIPKVDIFCISTNTQTNVLVCVKRQIHSTEVYVIIFPTKVYSLCFLPFLKGRSSN